MICEFEQFDSVGVFTFCGELTREYEDELKLVLMRAIHGIDRSVLKFNNVRRIDRKCTRLLKQAYRTSIRLKSPFIITGLSGTLLAKLTHGITTDKERDNHDYSFVGGFYGSRKAAFN
ncbi:MAG: hypothetical protein C4560_00940 [Nitrospiraceae bacterium]|nr:MAG: hypothetical protein C4560_00940 [Nitrospiraceae bacterium]